MPVSLAIYGKRPLQEDEPCAIKVATLLPVSPVTCEIELLTAQRTRLI